MLYRIKRREESMYHAIQYRRWWWLRWKDVGISFTSRLDARKHIQELKMRGTPHG